MSSLAVRRWLDAKKKGQEGLLVYVQEPFEHGPAAYFFDNVGMGFVEGLRMARCGAVVLGAWDTVGFDWRPL
jgi:hypothetical protein